MNTRRIGTVLFKHAINQNGSLNKLLMANTAHATSTQIPNSVEKVSPFVDLMCYRENDPYLKSPTAEAIYQKIQEYKKVFRHYIMSVLQLEMLDGIKAIDFLHVHAQHWNIERFHRAVKQTCNIERFQVRNKQSIMNHVFCAIYAFVQLELLRAKKSISN